jgi:hypothetical protein
MCVSPSSTEDILAYGAWPPENEGETSDRTKMPMETAELLHQFERATGKFAQAAVEAAVAPEETTPRLLRILQETRGPGSAIRRCD